MQVTSSLKAVKLLSPLILLLSLWGCVTNPISTDAIMPVVHNAVFEYPYFNDQATGIAISHSGRTFINFPRWDKDPLYSLAELLPDGSLRPYPDNEWNRWGAYEADHPEAHFVCVQSVTIDSEDFLWVLDPASPGFKGVIPGGVKLVRINLTNDTVDRVIPFDEIAAPRNSYLNDVRVDPDGDFAYITDSGVGAIIVVDLTSGKSRRLLANHPSTKAEQGYVPVIGGKELRDDNGKVPQIHADGIAIDATGEYLYYHALTARTLYRIDTYALNDAQLSEAQLAGYVEKVAATGAVDGMLMDADDNLYLTALEENTIQRIRPDGKIDTIAKDSGIPWPDSMAMSPDGYLYVTSSQINRMPRFNFGKDERILPYKLYKILLEL
jgi:sugar lactone lactonase YvrE